MIWEVCNSLKLGKTICYLSQRNKISCPALDMRGYANFFFGTQMRSFSRTTYLLESVLLLKNRLMLASRIKWRRSLSKAMHTILRVQLQLKGHEVARNFKVMMMKSSRIYLNGSAQAQRIFSFGYWNPSKTLEEVHRL